MSNSLLTVLAAKQAVFHHAIAGAIRRAIPGAIPGAIQRRYAEIALALNHGLIVGHRIVQALSFLFAAGVLLQHTAAAAGLTNVASMPPGSTDAHAAVTANTTGEVRTQALIQMPQTQSLGVTASSAEADPMAASITAQVVVTGTAGAGGDRTGSAASGPVYQIALRIIQGIFMVAGIASAVVFSALGLKILIASGVDSGYGVSKGIYAMLGAAAGLVLAFAGPSIANLIMKASEDGKLGTADSAQIYVPTGAK